jgi:hypothetical protein
LVGFLIESVVAFVIAISFSAVLVALLGWQRPDRPGAGASALFAFLILFFAVWAGGTWLQPLGPVLWGISWLPFLIVGLFVSLFMVVLIPPGPPRNRREAIEQAQAEEGARDLLSAFFWMLIVLLVIAVLFRYLA